MPFWKAASGVLQSGSTLVSIWVYNFETLKYKDDYSTPIGNTLFLIPQNDQVKINVLIKYSYENFLWGFTILDNFMF